MHEDEFNLVKPSYISVRTCHKQGIYDSVPRPMVPFSDFFQFPSGKDQPRL